MFVFTTCKTIAPLPVMLAVTLFAVACGGDSGTVNNPMNPPPPPPTGNGAPVALFTASPTSVPAGDGNTTVVTLNGSASSDPDGDTLTFSWTVPSGTFVNGTSATSVIPQVTFPGTGDYTVTLVVSDGNGGSDSTSFTVLLS